MNRAVASRVATNAASAAFAARSGSARAASSLNAVYNTFMRSTPLYTVVILSGSIVGTYVFSKAMDQVWESANQGVRAARRGSGRGARLRTAGAALAARAWPRLTQPFSQKLYHHIDWSKWAEPEEEEEEEAAAAEEEE